MSNKNFSDDWDDLDQYEVRNMARSKRLKSKKKKQSQTAAASGTEISALAKSESSFSLSYKAKLHEHQWLRDSLSQFYEQKWFDDILRLVKGGKEASVYQCLANPTSGRQYLAAKVYRPRKFRNLRKDHVYREGRDRLDNSGNVINDDGMHHAMKKRSAYGLHLLHTSWINHEFKTMQILHDAGVPLPAPLACGNNAILMDYVGDAEMPAPTLNSVDLGHTEAQELFEQVLQNVETMLDHGRVHADLSAFNILYWEGEIVFIDFPQAIDPQKNHSAYRIFERDMLRVCEYFQDQGVNMNPRKLASSIWRRSQGRINPLVHPLHLDAENEADREFWEKQTNG